MIFSALIVKFLSAGAVAQAATGATVAVVAFTGVGAVGALPDPVQDTFATVVSEITRSSPRRREETTEELVPEEPSPRRAETTDQVAEVPADVEVVRTWRPRSRHGPSRDLPTASRSAPGRARARGRREELAAGQGDELRERGQRLGQRQGLQRRGAPGPRRGPRRAGEPTDVATEPDDDVVVEDAARGRAGRGRDHRGPWSARQRQRQGQWQRQRARATARTDHVRPRAVIRHRMAALGRVPPGRLR